MFKRVDKRRRKKEEEDKLGLDEEMKEILGIQDTDSEESESESDDDDDEEEEPEGDVDGELVGEDEDEEEEEDPSITVSQALKDPVYIVSILPDIKACIICPGKLLKSVKMVQLHRTSNACTLSFVCTHFTRSPLKKKINRPISVALNNSAIALQMQSLTIMPGTFSNATQKLNQNYR